MVRKIAVFIGVWAAAALGAYAVAGAHDEAASPQLAADSCPDQTAALKSAGFEFDAYVGDVCPSMDRVDQLIALHQKREEQAAAERTALQQARETGQIGKDTDRWMIGVGDNERPLTDAEIAQNEREIAQIEEGAGK